MIPFCPFLGTLNIRCRIIIGIQKGTIILTTTHIPSMGVKMKEGLPGRSCLRWVVVGVVVLVVAIGFRV